MVAADRLVTLLLDPETRERAVVWVLIGFTAVWTLYGSISNACLDVHPDVGELIGAWRAPSLGFHHPPLAYWIVGTWFTFFPRADWASFLLVRSVVGLGLWISWKISGDWLDDFKRIVALAMLTLVPLLTFHALKFNVNVAMIPVWAATIWFFLRSLATCDRRYAALTGIAGGGALLAKYWSIYLVAGLGLAALVHGCRRRYFTSSAPWISIMAGLVVVAPHLYSLASGHDASLAFVCATLAKESVGISIARSIYYLVGAAGYVSVPVRLLLLLRPSKPALADVVFPATIDRRVIAVALWGPLLLPVLVNLLTPHRLTSLWTIPNWILFPVVLLSSPLVLVSRQAVTRILAVALVVSFGAIVAAPAVALDIHLEARPSDRPHFQQVARAVDLLWRDSTEKPLKYVGGEPEMASGVTYYLSSCAPNLAAQNRLSGNGSVATLKTVTEEVPSGTGRRGFRQPDRTAGR